ncbi:MAG: hypothetical protein RJA31_1132 [Actinomycetota bacterium]|jgi:hypothetical protein
MFARLALPSLAVVTLVAGCTAAVPLDPAEGANEPACAEVMVRLPDSVGGQARRSTNAQSTAAWGDPASVILRCGLPETGPSELPCFTVNGIDWLRDDTDAPVYRFITFGRNPATELVVDSDKASGVDAVDAVGTAVGAIPASSKCLSSEDVFG